MPGVVGKLSIAENRFIKQDSFSLSSHRSKSPVPQAKIEQNWVDSSERRNAACPNERHSPCMLSSLSSTAHNPSTTPDRSAHNGRSAYRPSTEFASPPLSSNAAVHRRRLNTMICFCIPFCSLSLFLAVIRLFRLFLSCVLPLPFHLL